VPKFGELLGQKIVVDNRPGASGNIGAAIAAKATPDGYTLLAFISSHVINPSLMRQIPYDLERDFIAISRTVTLPGVVVSSSAVPAGNLGELIAYAKANPAQLNFGSAGIGSMSHLMMELFQDRAGVKLLHVPYRGTMPALNDVLGNHVTLTSADLAVALPHIREGRLRAYGVTSSQRAAIAPDIPTLAEAGLPGYEALQWFGLVAPAGTPRPIIDKLYANLVKALDDPDLRKRFAEEGITPAPSASPDEFAAYIRAEAAKWGKIIKDNDIKDE
jgi:tripartite-type tricarboxylate transporter receptor subunit TctC